ncbi:MAG: hypothetical protein AMXMBFR82_34960 [Candidatus Hydrogenedentota bacterium]
MREILFDIEKVSNRSYLARAFGIDIFAEASSLDELYEEVGEAVQCHFEEDELPQRIRFFSSSPRTNRPKGKWRVRTAVLWAKLNEYGCEVDRDTDRYVRVIVKGSAGVRRVTFPKNGPKRFGSFTDILDAIEGHRSEPVAEPGGGFTN